VWLLLLLSAYGILPARRRWGVPTVLGVSLVMVVQNASTLVSVYHP